MEELLGWIDRLIEDQELPWERNGRELQIALSRTGRGQLVRLSRRRDHYVFTSIIAKVSAVNESRRDLAFRIWRRNALKTVVTFAIDDRDRVIGLIDQPIESIHAKELKFYLETLARECDRFEYIMTGQDVQ